MTDNETFAELIRQYSPALYRISYGILHSEADAEDAVGEAILKAYENLSSLRKPDCFKSWIMQITANEAKMIYRKKQRTSCVESIEEKAPAFIDNYHELWDAVMKLDLVFREVIILYFYESLSVKEIGRVLHIAEGTVKSRLFRGKKYLKDMLED